MGTNSLEHMGLECMSPTTGSVLSAGIEHMDVAVGGSGSASFDHDIEIEHDYFGGNFVGSFGGAGGHLSGVARKAC